MRNESYLNEYELEWSKRGGAIVASYSQENNGEGGSFNKSFLVKKLAENVFIGAETLSETGRFLAQESFRPEDIDDFCLVCMATREQCIDAGVEYIEPPILDESESKLFAALKKEIDFLKQERQAAWCRIDSLEQSIKNLHKVKGRHHKLVGLENNIGA